MMNNINSLWLLIYKKSNHLKTAIDFLEANGVRIKFANSEQQAIQIVRKYQIGIFLSFYDSYDESTILTMRKIMQQFPYIQRFLLSTAICNEMIELAINKAHINYFLPLLVKNEKLLQYINKAFQRYQNVVRPYNKLNKFADVTMELVGDIERYHREATRDVLTGLLNRRAFENVLDRFYNLYKKKKIPFVLAMVDLDKFKIINDTYGHSAGDLVLNKFGSIMKSCSRLGEDIVFRYGGEEFAIMSHGTSTAMKIYLNRLKLQVQNLDIIYENQVIKFTFSAGIANLKKKMSGRDLVKNADMALYYAKAHGRDQIIKFKKKLMEGKKET